MSLSAKTASRFLQLTVVALGFSAFHVKVGAQITVDQSFTINQYVNDILLGEGVTAANIQFTGTAEQIGYFSGGESVGFSMEGGLILGSGNAASAFAGDAGCGGDFLSEPGVSGEADLLAISQSVSNLLDDSLAQAQIDDIIANNLSGQATWSLEAFLNGQNEISSVNDVCVLEFDFDPAGDYVSFNYVFASQEYFAYEYSVYNDIFAFFLSGAGINGPYDAPAAFPDGAVNIAEVPGWEPQLPVTISSVNADINAEYFVSYQDGDIDGDGDVDVCFDGGTVVLTAVYPVECGQTYHIKLAVGDGTDTALPTFVFLEEGSFGSPIPTTYETQASPECDPDPDDDDIIYCAWEDCGPATITISRPCAVSSLFPFDFDLIAAPGSEVSLTDDLLGLPSSASIPVGEYGISLTFDVPQDNVDEGTETLYLKVVSGTIESEITIIIYDTPPFETDFPSLVTVPCDQTAEVCVELEQDPNYAYPPVSYNWTINGIDFGEDQCVTYGSLTTSLMEVYLVDGCGRTAYHQGVFEVPYDPIELTVPNDTLLCNGASAFMELEIAGGQPPYTVQWGDFEDEELVHLVEPDVSTEYEVVVVDNCDYSEYAATQVNVQTVKATIIRQNLGDDTYRFDALVSPEEPFEGAYFYEWDFGDGNMAFERNPVHRYDGLSTYEASVSVTTDIGCTDDAVMDVFGDVLFYIPTAFTPDNDGLNDAFEITGRQVRLFEMWIYDRWGNVVFHTTDLDDPWTGDVNGGTHYAPNGVYQWFIKATGFDTAAEEFRGFVNLMR